MKVVWFANNVIIMKYLKCTGTKSDAGFMPSVWYVSYMCKHHNFYILTYYFYILTENAHQVSDARFSSL